MSEVNRYFYVMWPEERGVTSVVSTAPTRAATSVAVAVNESSGNVMKLQGNGLLAASS